MSSETRFVSKQPQLEPKLVSALSETRRLFRLFRFNIETGSFGVSKQKTNRNSSKFVKISTFLIPHTISSVCFSCFNTGLKHRNKPSKKFGSFAKKQTEKQPKQIEFWFVLVWTENKNYRFRGSPNRERFFWRFFRFVLRKFCLFRLFRYRSETPKQTKKKVFWFCETNRKSTETDWVSVCFGSNRKKIWLFRGHPIYNIGAITLRNDDRSYMLRAVIIRSDNYSRQNKSVMRQRKILT